LKDEFIEGTQVKQNRGSDMKKYLFSSAIIAIFFLMTVAAFSTGLENFYGVWANKDCELVITSKYSLLFERANDSILATLKQITVKGDKITFVHCTTAIFDTLNKQAIVKKKNLPKQQCHVEAKFDKLIISDNGEIIEELSISENKLKILATHGSRHELELIEKITIIEPYEKPLAERDNIGRCLQEWELGSKDQKYFFGVAKGAVINTNKHSYIFLFAKLFSWEYIYCRAARIRSNNQGSVFAQNIRLMKDPRSNRFTAWMAHNNLEMATKNIVINDSHFNPQACVYAEQVFYWSLKSFDKDLIVIHGCGGEDYKYERPKIKAKKLLEWFEFKNYAD